MSGFCGANPPESPIEKSLCNAGASFRASKSNEECTVNAINNKDVFKIFQKQQHRHIAGGSDSDTHSDSISLSCDDENDNGSDFSDIHDGGDGDGDGDDDDDDDDTDGDDVSSNSDEIFVHSVRSILKQSGVYRQQRQGPKKVTFNPKMKVVLITCNDEYREMNLKNVLWYRSIDYLLFKAGARLIIESPFREYYNHY